MLTVRELYKEGIESSDMLGHILKEQEFFFADRVDRGTPGQLNEPHKSKQV